jgi:hypothetical protein
MAAEILSCEVDNILNALFDPWIIEDKETIARDILQSTIEDSLRETEEIKVPLEEAKEPKHRLPLLEQLLSALDISKVNPVLSGYFFKIIEVFIERRQLEFLGYIFGFKEHVENLLKHIYDRHVADTIKKIVSNEDRYFAGTTGNEFIYDKMLIIDRLIDMLDPSNPPESIRNSSYVLCDLIKGKQHLAYFNETKVLKRVFDAVSSGSGCSLCAGIDYLTELLKLNAIGSTTANTDNLYFIGYDNFEQIEENNEEKLDYSELMILAADCLSTLKDLLLKKGEIKYGTQFGAKILPFGGDRVKVINFLHALMEIKDDIFCQKFQELEVPSLLLELMEVYYMNTILHTCICKIFTDGIKSGIAFLIDMVMVLCERSVQLNVV